MTSAIEPAARGRHDARSILTAAAKLGLVTVVGVVIFALLSRALGGAAETIVQSALILLGGAVFAYFPAATVRPRDVDTVAWAALIGLLGALVFTVIDTAVLRPLNLYHWTWDEIGGGSGFWYIPVWWMGSATLAWLGAWIYSRTSGAGGVNVAATAAITLLIAVILFGLMAITGIAPFHAAVMALAFAVALIVHVPLAGAVRRQ